MRRRANQHAASPSETAAGHLILLSDRGELALAEARRDGLVVKRRRKVLDGRSWTPRSLAFGRLFVRNHQELVCLAPVSVERERVGGEH